MLDKSDLGMVYRILWELREQLDGGIVTWEYIPDHDVLKLKYEKTIDGQDYWYHYKVSMDNLRSSVARPEVYVTEYFVTEYKKFEKRIRSKEEMK